MSGRPETAAQVAARALARADEAVAMHAETLRLVQDMHRALMEPMPGTADTFVVRVMRVVSEAEAGKIVGERLVWYAKVLAALSAIGAAFAAVSTWMPR